MKHCTMVCSNYLQKSKFFFSSILALNAMQTSVDSIGTNTNTVIVMALVSGPVVRQNLV